jgi:hypothetical protein
MQARKYDAGDHPGHCAGDFFWRFRRASVRIDGPWGTIAKPKTNAMAHFPKGGST